MKFCFFGTPKLAVDILEHLKRHRLVPSLVVTNPDRPQGRNMTLAPPPVKVWAAANGISVLQPECLNPLPLELRASSFELFVVVAYGALLPKEVLALPRRGSLNLHYSLLPTYRGASPIESAILNDDKDTGVSIVLLDEKMDHGPVVAERGLRDTRYAIHEHEWPLPASELRRRCNGLGAELLTETIPLWVAGKIQAKEQEHARATYTQKFTKADGDIDLAGDSYENFLKIQAFEGGIGTFFYHSPFVKGSTPSNGGRDISPTKGSAVVLDGRGVHTPRSADGAPPFRGGIPPASAALGTPFRKGGTDEKRIRVLIKSAEHKNGRLHILRVVPEGRREMSYEEFLRGAR